MKLKLGKGSSFVKSRLRRFPQEDAVWEAAFQPITDEEHVEFWLGMVVDQEIGVELAHQVLEAAPNALSLRAVRRAGVPARCVKNTRSRSNSETAPLTPKNVVTLTRAIFSCLRRSIPPAAICAFC